MTTQQYEGIGEVEIEPDGVADEYNMNVTEIGYTQQSWTKTPNQTTLLYNDIEYRNEYNDIASGDIANGDNDIGDDDIGDTDGGDTDGGDTDGGDADGGDTDGGDTDGGDTDGGDSDKGYHYIEYKDDGYYKIDYHEPQALTSNSILIILFSVIGLVLFASLVGFSLSKRPCTFERRNPIISGTNSLIYEQTQINDPSFNDTTVDVGMANPSEIKPEV